ncbi:thioredoxin family protein [Aliiroseovarius crassostreae]|uniref:thioredoxin family protein n=1 Tax=Aliiroseovarius crassostreae TaxID=154981 RepID=UPI0021FB103D|nr:thioredoxin family protein [Aliiroseovarius crassostreae]UWQ09387.1 thioredoxin family protein [Aliiroseovarius crassostreae]UWQ12463.1 thioredoxin family protein [Aliiroseovarius crassostreae]
MRRTFSKIAAAFVVFGSFALTAEAAELVMVEEPGCAWCAQWEHDLGAIYPKTPEGKYAPLSKLDLRATRKETLGFTLARPVSFTPTFLLVEDGQEMARIEGYPGEDFFWGLLEKMLLEHTRFAQPEG